MRINEVLIGILFAFLSGVSVHFELHGMATYAALLAVGSWMKGIADTIYSKSNESGIKP